MHSKKHYSIISLGTMLIWAEFIFFAYMADHLSKIFFPTGDIALSRLKIYGAFAASYIMRPIGAIIFGHMGDKYGRRISIMISLLLMAFATCGIGLLPSYKSIGSISSIFLIIFRMLQGIAISGEFNGSKVMLTEDEKKRPFFIGSLSAFSASVGMVIGSISAAIISYFNNDFLWRIPFLLSSIIAFIAIYLRRDIQETQAFLRAKNNNELFVFPLIAAVKYNKSALACAAAFSMFIAIFVYTGNVYYKSIAVNIGGLSTKQAAIAVTIGVSLNTILIPIFASLADKFNGYKICFYGLFLAFIFSPLIMSMGSSGNFFYTILGQIIYGILDAMVSATAFTIMLREFKTGTKYSGSALASSISTAIFGSSALIINEFFVTHLKIIKGPGIYMSLSALLCLLILKYFLKVRIELSYSQK